MTADSREPFDPGREDGVEEAGVWIRDTLGRAAGGFYHLGYSSAYPSGWTSPEELNDRTHLEEFRLVAEGLRAHGGQKNGLMVLVTDNQPDGRSRCYLAFQIGHLLAEGGARVLLLDAEFEGEGPAHWLGDPQREGLLDVARYGASPRSTLQRSGLRKVDLMGAGSYRPQESDPLTEEELLGALHQLRAGWQFILCTAPARTREGVTNPLFQRCDGVLMGLMLEGEARDGFEELADHLMEARIPIFGVMAFPRPGLPEAGAEGSLGEAEAAGERSSVAAEEESSTEFSSRPVSPYSTEAGLHRHSSSRLFRRLTLGIAVVLLLFLGSWAAIQWTQNPERKGEIPTRKRSPQAQKESPAAREGSPTARQGGSTEAGPERSVAVDRPEAPSSSSENEEPALDLQHAILAGGTEKPQAASPGKTVASEEQSPASTMTQTQRSQPSAAAKGTIEPEVTRESGAGESGSEATQRLAKALRLRPHRGWALHPWSFRDSTQALPSVRKLRAAGMDPIVVKADLGKKGIWYRVLVGNYDTRRDALDARPLLQKRRDVTDSVGIIKVGD